MVFRFAWLASFSLLALVVLRLTRLFLPTEEGLPWPVVIIVAAALGSVITWVALRARLGTVVLVLGHLVLFGLFVFMYVGGELAGQAVPPAGVVDEIVSEVSDALTIFRFSAPPVTPLAGIVALAAMMIWALSATATWGLMNSSPYLGIVPPVVFYLQLAVIDRQSTGMLWTTSLLLLVGAGLASIAADQRAGGGRTGHGPQAGIQAWVLPVLAIVSVTAVSVLVTRQAVATETVPRSGLLDWTNRSGLGGGFGSVSYNPFIDVQRSLVSNSNQPVFVARVAGDIPDGKVYWRLLTMDTFNGDWWYASDDGLEDLDETRWEDEDYEFRGDTIAVTQDVTILDLASAWLPSAYSPIGLFSEERLIANTTRVGPVDASLHIDGVTGRGMTYRVESLIPDVDVRVLAATEDGSDLSPLFQEAADEGEWPPVPPPVTRADRPGDLDRYLQLPDEVESEVALTRLAQTITLGLETDYEKALALEHFFRDPALFQYSTNVAPNERDSGIVDWLLNPSSPGYRTGYCEQFSASMAVLARLLDIPTRTVLGFTPGETRPDQSILVRDRNAHAWVEVWLPAQGWVRFDPTPRGDGVNPTTFEETGLSATDLERYFTRLEEAAREAQRVEGGGGDPAVRDPDLEDLNRFPGGGGGDNDGAAGGFSLPGWVAPALAGLAGVAAVLGPVPAIKRRRRRLRLKRLEEGDVGAAWAEIVDRLIDAGVGVSGADTPVEVAAATDSAMEPLAEIYSESVYGPQDQLPEAARQRAESSLTATEQKLRARESRWQRIRRTYRVRSLLPEWIKRGRSR